MKLPHPFALQQYALSKDDEFPLKLMAWDQLNRSLPLSVSVNILYHQVAACVCLYAKKSICCYSIRHKDFVNLVDYEASRCLKDSGKLRLWTV